MLKCRIDRHKTKRIFVKASGTCYDITLETLVLIKDIFYQINKQNPEAGAAFKNTIIAGVLDPNSPVWKDEDHADNQSK